MVFMVFLALMLTLTASHADKVLSEYTNDIDRPWMLLVESLRGTGDRSCQGVIVDKRLFLTSSSCAKIIQSGDWQISVRGPYSVQMFNQINTVSFETPVKDQKGTPDFVLVRVDAPFDFNFAGKVKLPDSKSKIKSLKKATLVSLGAITLDDSRESPNSSPRPRQIEIKVDDEANCKRKCDSSDAPGSYPPGACIYREDSKGKPVPLEAEGLALIDGAKHLVGFGYKKVYDKKGNYVSSFFTDIGPHVDWIKKMIAEDSYEKKGLWGKFCSLNRSSCFKRDSTQS